MTGWRPIVRAVGWVVVYLAAGLLLTALPFVLYIRYSPAPDTAALTGNSTALLLQGVAQLAVFGFLTWLIGRRVLKLSPAQLGWVSQGREKGFGRGLLGAMVLAGAALMLGVALGGARWLPDTGGVLDYLRNVGLTTSVLAPAALAEEVAFRGLPLVLLASVFGRGSAIVVMSLIFGLAHGLNPDVTPLAIGNVALAGVFLSLAFYAPGGIWTAWGAHLGWNATLAALDAPVSGLPFRIPLINFDPGTVTWLTGGSFGPEGGVAATVVLCAGCAGPGALREKGRLGMKQAAVVGGGTMGNGIAHVFALNGWSVTLIDAAPAALDKALKTIRANLERQAKKGTIPADAVEAALARIRTAGDAAGRRPAPTSRVEAVSENPQVKFAVFQALDKALGPDAILASNTSSISITELAAKTGRPDKVVGMHFMNPVPMMELVEVIRGHATSDATTAAVMDLSRALGKTPVEVNDYPGFVANRVLMPMINEAIFCVMEGVATPEAIDTVMKLGMAHPMGPLALADFIGLDVCLAILEVLHRGLGDDKYRPCPLLRRMVAAGHLGRKSGQGFYDYRK